MPILADFSLSRLEDATLTVSLVPPTAIGGWTIRWQMQHRFGGISGIATKWLASGFNGVSGITIVNSGQGVFNVAINSIDTSGLDFGNYANASEKMDSGSRTVLTEGYALLMPSVGV